MANALVRCGYFALAATARRSVLLLGLLVACSYAAPAGAQAIISNGGIALGVDSLGQLNVPDGTGGLIFNWHVDAGWAIPALERAEASGIFDQGPFSIDFTAGPDVDNRFDDATAVIGHDHGAYAPLDRITGLPGAQYLLGRFV